MRKQMGPCLLLTICVTTLVAGLPQGEMGDDRVGLDRPSTSPVPEISEGNLNGLINDLFGGSVNNPNSPSNINLSAVSDNYDGNIPPTNSRANPNGCECVPFYLCDDNNTFIEDGQGLLDIRIKDEVCQTYDLKCCGGTNIRKPTNPVEVFTHSPLTPGSPTGATNKCGIRNSNGVGVRITGAEDNEAQYGEFPWMVAVVQPDVSKSQNGKPVYVYQCGGSLIHPQVVLTGAHCVTGKNNLVIRAGEWDTQTKNELYPTQDVRVREVVIHEQFNNNTLANDPALLILEAPVDTSFENVGLICLPEENENMDGHDCVASGWGMDQFGKESKYQVILKRVDMPVVQREPCLEALRKTRLGTHFKLHPSFICAGGIPGRDTCKGDGGGPLACPSKNDREVYVQAGIVAWGINCGTETPGVYVNVPAFVPWINKQLQQHSIFLLNANENNNNGGYNRPTDNHNNGVYNPPSNNATSVNPEDCKCVPLNLCDDNTTTEDGVALINISIKDKCRAYDQKCCKEKNIRAPNNPVVTPQPPPSILPAVKRCGTRNFDGVSVRITGDKDNEAQYGEFPWMVAVLQTDTSHSNDGEPLNLYLCGGSLIHPKVVLTGAHCVEGKSNLMIRAGEWDTQATSEPYPTQDLKVREVIIHEQFSNSSLINDPALLILEAPVNMSLENVGLICLPEENENMDGRDCVASGWGKDQFGKEGKYQVILKRVEVPIVQREQCLEALQKTRLSMFFKLHPSFICAGGVPGKDTCKGDGGSPLACPSKNNSGVYVQAGIVAWGINCGTVTPGVYVNVPAFVPWINNQLQKHSIII